MPAAFAAGRLLFAVHCALLGGGASALHSVSSHLGRRRTHSPYASCIDPSAHAILTFVRHGQSEWNAQHVFTGWADVDLTDLGRKEAVTGGVALHRAGIDFDLAFTSELKRAQNTLRILLEGCEQPQLPVIHDYRLNERHYGALQGRCKYEVQREFGKAQVHEWSRSYDVAPPPVKPNSPHAPQNDHKYDHLPRDVLPLTESLKDQMERCRPFWRGQVEPALRAGKNVLVVSHGNAIRGCVKLLDGISDEQIPSLEIPHGIPLIYQLDAKLQPLHEPGAEPPLRGVFVDHLVDRDTLVEGAAVESARWPSQRGPAASRDCGPRD